MNQNSFDSIMEKIKEKSATNSAEEPFFNLDYLKAHIRAIQLPPTRWIPIANDDTITLVKILDDLSVKTKIFSDRDLHAHIVYDGKYLKWIQFDPVKSLDDVSLIVKIIDTLQVVVE